MSTLILIRHGETIWNKEGRFQGHVNVPLSETGVRQAELVRDYLKDYSITAVYTSDLVRAAKTAQIIATPHGLSATPDQRLREFSFGIWEGLTRIEIEQKYKALYLERQRNAYAKVPGGETAIQLQSRAMEAVYEICHKESGVVVLVSHGGTIRSTLATMLGMDLTNSYRLMVGNTTLSVVHWEFKEGAEHPQFIIETINNGPHLQ